MTFVYRVKNTERQSDACFAIAKSREKRQNQARAARVTSVLRCDRLCVSRSHLLGPMNASTGFLCKEMRKAQMTIDRSI